MIFKNRSEAGRALAAEVAQLVTPPCVVGAIPRGGVAVALPIAQRLGAPLAVAYARKLTARLAPELAFGALDEDGEAITDESTVATLGLTPREIQDAKRRTAAEIKRRMTLYRVPPLAHYLPGSAVVLVDDGLATGLTMRAAVAYARRHGATRVIVAVPCASTQAAERFRREADIFVSLTVDHELMAVGQYYVDFSPVEDDEVVQMLERAARERTPARSPGPEGPSDWETRASFANSRGWRLAGVLLMPEGRGPHPAVVFAHGWGSGKDSPRNRAAGEALRAEGLAAFLFDFTGHGESEGLIEHCAFPQQDDDLRAALDVLSTFEEIDTGRIGIAGASSGATAALARAAVDPRIRALALWSVNPEGAESAALRVTAPMLLVVGEHDEWIRGANEVLLVRLSGERRLEVVPGGDHLFEDPDALRQAIALTVAWFKQHLTASPTMAARSSAPTP